MLGIKVIRIAVLISIILLISVLSMAQEFPFWVYTSYKSPDRALYEQIKD